MCSGLVFLSCWVDNFPQEEQAISGFVNNHHQEGAVEGDVRRRRKW